jgi:hypothetical protein
MKTLWILAAAATFAACANRNEEDVGAAPDRGEDTTAITTEVDTATGTWDTTGATGDVNAEPSDTAFTPTAPSDTALTPTTPSDTSVGQYPTPSDPSIDTTGMDSGMGTDTTMTSPDTGAYAPDTSAYVPDTGVDTSSTGGYDPSAADPSAGVDPSTDTAGMDSGMGTDTTSTYDPNAQ